MKLHSLFVPAVLLSTPAWADITADDVWANTTAFYRATGGTLEATLTRDADTVFVEDASLRYALPYNMGAVVFVLPAMTMVEKADGTVTQKLPKSFDLTVAWETVDSFLGYFAVSVGISQTGFAATASGTPGDVTYTRSADAYTAGAKIILDELPLEMSFAFDGDGYSQTTRVEEGDLIKVTTEQDMQVLRYSYETTEEYGYTSEGSGEYGQSVGRIEMALPAEGGELMNPSASLAQGMFIKASNTQSYSRDEAITYLDGEVMNRDNTIVGPGSSTFTMSQDGLSMGFDMADLEFTFEDYNFIPLVIDTTASTLTGTVTMPLIPNDQPQAVAFQTTLSDLALSDEVWDLVDPEQTISRAPADLVLDMTGEVIMAVDLMDFENIENAFLTLENPIAPQNLSLNAAGVTAEGAGQFSFDNTDLTTFDGLPRPEGNAEITITGTNALLDTLTDTGPFDAEDVGFARMVLNMFTRPTGDDALTITVDFTPEGHLMVNDGRLR